MNEELGYALLTCVGIQNNKFVNGSFAVSHNGGTCGSRTAVGTCWYRSIDAGT